MKKVLITGGSGFFGSRFTAAYRHRFEILSTGSQSLNVLDSQKINNAFELFKPDIVIHAAAVAKTDYCNSNPDRCHAVNVDGALNIAKACLEYESRMIFLSTEQVFNGNRENGPYSESHIPLPDTIYGKNKLEAEKLIKNMLKDYLILRFTWMFGMPGRFQPVVNNILWDTVKAIMKGETISAPEFEHRGYTDLNEVIDQFQKIMVLPSATYHVGSANSLNRFEIVKLIFTELGLENRIPEMLTKDVEKYKDSPRDARLDTSLIQSKGIIFSETTLAIKRCIREYNLKID